VQTCALPILHIHDIHYYMNFSVNNFSNYYIITEFIFHFNYFLSLIFLIICGLFTFFFIFLWITLLSITSFHKLCITYTQKHTLILVVVDNLLNCRYLLTSIDKITSISYNSLCLICE